MWSKQNVIANSHISDLSNCMKTEVLNNKLYVHTILFFFFLMQLLKGNGHRWCVQRQTLEPFPKMPWLKWHPVATNNFTAHHLPPPSSPIRCTCEYALACELILKWGMVKFTQWSLKKKVKNYIYSPLWCPYMRYKIYWIFFHIDAECSMMSKGKMQTFYRSTNKK